MKHLRLVSVLSLLFSGLTFGQEKSPFIAVDELKNLVSDVIVFDLCSEEEFAAGHIEGAFQISRKDIGTDNGEFKGAIAPKSQLVELMNKFKVSAKDALVVYDHKGGCDAARFWWVMRYYGHKNIRLLDGGLQAWDEGSVNHKRTILPHDIGFEFSSEQQDILASKEDVIKALEDENILLIDTRSIEEFEGTFQKDGASRSGRIPESININWISTITFEGDQLLKSKGELLEIFESKGITKDKNVIVYCHSGTRSSHTSIVLREILGYPNVKNYDGSWIEWSSDTELLIETGTVSPLRYVSYSEIFSATFNGYYDYIWNQITFKSRPWYENYFWFLVAISLLVWGLEILFPWRKNQARIRKDFWLDAFFMFFNFYIFNLIIFLAFSRFLTKGFYDISGLDLTATSVFDMGQLPWLLQLLIFFLATDFVQWITHVALHRFDFLWKFHKVHHSVEQMGFAAHLRYHWMETLFYTPMKFIAIMFIGGFAPEQAFIIYFFTIAIGHLNHANISLSYGPLKYLLNNPKMHIWHHAKTLPEDKKYGVNFGISLSIWDYIFRKNYIPSSGRDIPLGFENMEQYPQGFFGLIFSGFRKEREKT
jgi:3-mercaptopyruvate sulfurtransferase SseA/sterol desaturase/sphingolipid hydroxylase (fatty acid hydroxylase superfamily)